MADSKALAIGVELEFAVEVDGGTQEMVAMELSEVIGNMRVLKVNIFRYLAIDLT